MLTCISRSHKVCVSAFWAHSGLWHFTCKLPYEVALLQCWHAFRLTAQARTKCVSAFWAHVALLQCWHAFRLRGLAQSVCLGSGPILVCSILPVNFRMKWLFCNVDMHFECAGSHKVCVCVLCFFWSEAFYPWISVCVDMHAGSH